MTESEIMEARKVFQDLLNLISSAAEQFEYEASVPIANVPAELVCMWFDDHYYPNSEWFLECFSPQGRDTLAEFHRFYEARVDALPDTEQVSELQKSTEWQEVMAKAKEAAGEIEWATEQGAQACVSRGTSLIARPLG